MHYIKFDSHLQLVTRQLDEQFLIGQFPESQMWNPGGYLPRQSLCTQRLVPNFAIW